jgi:hypothetical protein
MCVEMTSEFASSTNSRERYLDILACNLPLCMFSADIYPSERGPLTAVATLVYPVVVSNTGLLVRFWRGFGVDGRT